MHKIELLYFDGCPSWQSGLAALQQVMASENLDFPIRMIEIKTPEQAQSEHFLGSPSYRVDGVDLWPETRHTYDMSCRVYQTAHGLRGIPTNEMLRARINERLASQS